MYRDIVYFVSEQTDLFRTFQIEIGDLFIGNNSTGNVTYSLHIMHLIHLYCKFSSFRSQAFVWMAVQLLWILEQLLLLVQQYVFRPLLIIVLVFKNLFLLNRRHITSFQTILTQINHAIGAEGVVSSHCKTIVHDYGRTLWERLLSGVSSFINLQYGISGVSSFDLIRLLYCSYILIMFAMVSVRIMRH